MAPFVRKHHFNLRSTDDQFTMVIECTDKTNLEGLQEFLKSTGAFDVHVQDAETGWWLGTYSKNIPSVDNPKTILV
jgi:hypothetical protein